MIDNVTVGLGIGIHTVLHSPSGPSSVYILDDPGVGVFSRAKSAGVGVVVVSLFYCSTCCRLLTLKFYQFFIPKNFEYMQPPRIYSVVCFPGLTV